MNLGFLILIGLPGSGKTTLAKALKNNYRQYEGKSYHFIHICYDELIPFSNKSQGIEWKILRNSVASNVEKLVIAIKCRKKELSPAMFAKELESLNSFDSGYIILIIDDNMYFKSMRYTIYLIARNHSISFCQVFINCSLETALMKNKEREPNLIVPDKVIENMNNKIELPNTNNTWENFSVNVNAFGDVNMMCEKLFPVLIDSFNNCKHTNHDNSKQRELSILQCKKNVLHQTELALRKIVGKKIKEFHNKIPNLKLKEYSSQLYARKSELFFDVKVGNILLTDIILQEIEMGLEEKSQLINFLNNYF